MFDRMDLPSLRLNMNPRRGMVAVPTWFWVEGYDGGVIPLEDELALQHQECHTVVDRDDSGAAQLDAGGSPGTHSECQTITDTVSVEVRAWPRTFRWTFGDDQEQTVTCPEIAACLAGIGLPFTDSRNPSPIAHAYRWSSLGANGDADAYTIGLAITFGGQYRFSTTNGGPRTSWEGLDDRDLVWSAIHQVQQAQAVLTGP